MSPFTYDEVDKVDNEKQALLPEKKVSLLKLTVVTSFSLPLAFIWTTLGFLLAPAEAVWLFPKHPAFYNGTFFAITGGSALFCPIAGMMSDRYRSSWGRRRPFILLVSIVLMSGLTCMWACSVWRRGYHFIAALAVTMVALNSVHSSQQSFVPDGFASQKSEAAGIVATLFFLGGLLGMVWMLCTTQHDFHMIYPMYTLVITSSIALLMVGVSETPSDRDPPAPPFTLEEVASAYSIDLKKDLDFFWVFCGRTMYYMCTSMQAFLYFYFRDMMLAKDDSAVRWCLGVLLAIALLAGLCTSFPASMVSERYGRKRVVYYACGCMSIAYTLFSLAPLLGPERGMIAVYINALIYGMGAGSFQSVDYALALDCLPKDDGKSRAKGSSEALGTWGTAEFIGGSVGPLIAGCFLELTSSSSHSSLGVFFHAMIPQGGGNNSVYTYPGFVFVGGMGILGSCMCAVFTSFIKGVK